MRSTTTHSRRTALLVAAVCLLQTNGVTEARDWSCDDGSTPASSCGFVLPDPENVSYCREDRILALKRGCFVCVEASSCDVPNSSKSQVRGSNPKSEETLDAENHQDAIDAKPAAARMVPAEIVILPIHDAAEHAESEKGVRIHPHEAAAAAVPVSANAQPPAFGEVSNWYFLVPAFLALISVGLALRSQIEKTRQEFERVGDQDHDDEINPFCDDEANPQGDDEDLEFGKHYDSDETTDETENDRDEL